MKKFLNISGLIALFVFSSLLQTSTSSADQGYEDQNGKIEAVMMDQIRGSQKKAVEIIQDIIVIQDSIDQKWKDEEEFSQGRLKAVGALLAEADEIKIQIDLSVLDTEMTIDEKYNKISRLMRRLLVIQTEVKSFLE